MSLTPSRPSGVFRWMGRGSLSRHSLDNQSFPVQQETDAAQLLRLQARNAELEAELETVSFRNKPLEIALSYTPDFLYTLDTNGRLTYINHALESLWRKSLAEVLGKNFFDIGYPLELAAKLQAQVQEVISKKQSLRDEAEYTGADGRTGYYEYIFVPVMGENAIVEAVAGSTREITERREAEAALRESEERFSAAFADAPVGMVLTSPQGKFIEANPAYLAMLGYSPEELASRNSDQYTHPDDVAVTHRFGEALRRGEINSGVIEKRYFRKDGQLLWARASGSMRRDSEGRPTRFIAVIEDITDRKRAEEALQASEERLQQVFAQAPVAVCVVRGRNFVCDLANPYFRDLFPGNRFLGRPLRDSIFRESTEILAILERVMDTGQAFFASESRLPIDKDLDGIPEDCWFNFVYQPLRELDGAVSAIVVVAVDVSSQVRARQSLELANRELEEFAYVASHDLQEPLRMVNVYTQLLMRDLKPHLGEATGVFAAQVNSGVRRMEQLLKDLLQFAHVSHRVKEEAEQVQAVDLNNSFQSARNFLQNRVEEEQAVITADRLPMVRGGDTQLTQVFQNLLSNALKYSKANQRARVRVTAQRRGQEWVVSVQDNGIGFEQEQAERVFGLFKRLHKEQYPGTGLGLAICKRIIERYNGRIWAESSLGNGSTFFFALPAAEP